MPARPKLRRPRTVVSSVRRPWPTVAGLVVCLLALAVTSSAQAAFPGRNGVLAVQPLGGAGLILIDAHGKHRQLVCTDETVCGRPATPRFSPDGREIAFADTRTHSPLVLATDGTCLWCLLGNRLTSLTGSTPAFTASGLALTLSAKSGLWQTPLAPGATHEVASGKVSGAVWSSTGALAFASAGAVWLSPHGDVPHRLIAGSAPNFAPGGQRLTFVHDGWIWVMKLPHGKPRRLARGTTPTYSPDGHSIAFIGHGGHIYVVRQGGGRPRLVPGVRGRALDWQPVPGHLPARCAVPAGSSVVARSAEAVVTDNPATPATPWYGCLIATGVRRTLVRVPSLAAGSQNALVGVALTGRYVLLSTSYATVSACRNVVARVDLGNAAAAQQLYTRKCDAGLQGIDDLGLDSSGFAAWRARERVASAQAFVGLSCPSTALCVAVDGKGNAATSSTSAGAAGTWSLAKVTPAFAGVTCANGSLCLGISGAAVVTSTDPAGAAWANPVPVDVAPLVGVSCDPTGSLCAALDSAGNVVSSTDPTGGAGQWHATSAAAPGALTSISCPTFTLCVAVGQNGQAVYSTNPAATTPTWTTYTAGSTATLLGLTCPSSTFCLATDGAGHVLTTTDPMLGVPWTQTVIPGETGALYQPTCDPSVDRCAARDTAGNVVTSGAPGSATSWSVNHVGNPLTGLACPASGLCVATDGLGDVYTSASPGTPGAWTATPVDVPPCGACVAEQLYVQDDRGRQAIDTALPGTGSVIGDVALAGNSRTVRWSDNGVPAQPYTLR